MKRIKSLLNKMSSPMRPPAGLGDLRLIKSFVSKVFSFFITTQSAEDSRQRHSGMTALFDVKAFTLVELLVVVLIIGILSAIAIPMYQGAVDKSHWSTMLPASKAIKDAEEAFKMTNGEYSDTMEHLDVQMNNSDLTFTLNTPNNLSQPNVVRVTNSKLGNNVRLASYLDDSPKFAGQLHCEAKTGDDRAIRLCDKLLQGSEFFETDDGYMGYLLNQEVDSGLCNNAQGSWSTSKTKCYNTTAERCEALGMGVVATMDDQCGYTDGIGGKNVGNEGVCLGLTDLGCHAASIGSGGKCIAKVVGGCNSAFIHNGGACEDTIFVGCANATIYTGGKCIAKAPNTCSSGYIKYQGGCCEEGVPGQTNCASNAPKC